MTAPLALVLALLIDAALGEPRWLWSRVPHPVVWIGNLISRADRTMNRGMNRRRQGIVFLGMLVGAGLAAGFVLAALPGWWVEVIVAAILLAQRSLADHVAAVARALDASVPAARLAVGQIVGRDTSGMTPPDIARAAIESGAENLSDGVVAPAFWFLVGGLPGLLVYKAVNTADSMVGYLTPRHQEFGWAAARFDDLLNLVPARLTAGLVALAGPARSLSGLAADARRHRSPNAGWPEAAMARALGVALSGPRSYAGTRQDFPFVHPHGRRLIGAEEVRASVRVLWRVWALMLLALIALALA